MLRLDWPAIVHDLGLGHPLKFIQEENAQHLTTCSNFWKQFYGKFPQYRLQFLIANNRDREDICKRNIQPDEFSR